MLTILSSRLGGCERWRGLRTFVVGDAVVAVWEKYTQGQGRTNSPVKGARTSGTFGRHAREIQALAEHLRDREVRIPVSESSGVVHT